MVKIEGNLKCIKIFGVVITTQKRLNNVHLNLYFNEEDVENINKKLKNLKQIKEKIKRKKELRRVE